MLKVLHLPTSVGGNAWGLSRGERSLGLASDVLVATDTWLGYPADIHLNLENTAAIAKLIKLAVAFASLRSKYDIFHFNGGSALIHSLTYRLNHLELPLYPKGAKLFVTYNGCDARQKYPTMQRTSLAACYNPNCYSGQCNSGRLDEMRRRGIERMGRYVRHIWALNPDLLYFLPPGKASFLPYSLTIPDAMPISNRIDGRLLMVHAPTNREAKGTQHILAALEKLALSHPGTFEIQLVENLPHIEAIKLYREADLVLDQVLIGWYGGLAVEAMHMGKPVVARIAKEDLHFIPDQMARDVLETVIQADPDSIYQVLAECIEDRARLRRHSEASADYVRKWHDPKYVAGLTKEKYETA